jgi:hypothetical protein
MIGQQKYVPILKGKSGEFSALEKLDGTIKDLIVPIIDMVPNPTKTFEKSITDFLGYITKKWIKDKLIYIDGYMIQDQGLMASGMHPLQFIFEELNKKNYNAIPVISNVTDPGYNDAVKKVCEKDNKGVCIRIFRKSGLDINDELNRLTSFLNINPNSCDLVIDLRSLEDIGVEEIYLYTLNLINNLNYLSEWRSFVLSGGSFPIDLTELKPDQVHIIQRKEWTLWNNLLHRGEIERFPSFSDYAISHPLLSNIDIGIPNASASIRYTNEGDFYVYRGRGTRQHSFDQFYDLSESLINSSEYYGQNHCPGDEFIQKCGVEKKKTGSLTTWRWVGTVHHLTVSANQVLQFWRNFNASRTS